MRRLLLLSVLALACSGAPPERHTLRRWSGSLVGQTIGGVLGSTLAARMDANDRRRAGGVLEEAAMHETRTWVNPETGASWEMTPIAGSAGGAQCRDFAISTQLGLEDLEEAYGTACREPSGDWRITG